MLQSAQPFRFVTAKVWGVRLGIIGAVALSCGLFGLVLTSSWWGAGAFAFVGGGVIRKRAFRVDTSDIRF